SDENKILYSSFRIGETMLMASDCYGDCKTAFQGFSLSLTLPDETEAGRLFAVLADGGQVQMPLGKTFWSPCFGVVSDRFGMSWMVSVMP
ncbi:MAG: 3-demethylubiquinone-9 3-methyltransferase, partial [Chthoniobacteraceae bacterium]|nr:3-demethylubiquinone-9 3-methyltransferase [Chthoniobacteraceae bacterium]